MPAVFFLEIDVTVDPGTRWATNETAAIHDIFGRLKEKDRIKFARVATSNPNSVRLLFSVVKANWGDAIALKLCCMPHEMVRVSQSIFFPFPRKYLQD